MNPFSIKCSNCHQTTTQSVGLAMAKEMGFDGIVCLPCYKALLEVQHAIKLAENASDCDTCCMGTDCNNPEFGSKTGCDAYIDFEEEDE
jgi:hypothetical protein